MKIVKPAKQVTIYVGSSDQWHGKQLAMAILERAHAEGLAGGSIISGTAGFGAHARMHTSSLVDLAHDLPVMVHLVDVEERIATLLAVLDDMLTEALVVVEDCEVIRYVH